MELFNIVYCIACGQLREATDLHKVFQMGFRQSDGVDYIRQHAVQNRSRVRLTLFETHYVTVLEGTPVYDGRLRIATDYGI
ncbi:hypothetical protein AYW79_04275 [Ferroacidibacillus organovorans]|uniref:Uncharacterized protein n=1 Tax=Ferroacidibacillus organovorans TaxID=1765683 RepID=A0A853KED0_9BACL|nr:hypothetical protein AYJ22_03340 [Ferroacidibacillus organovorans]OAG94579.1 hypothetical protein AYW79_04275 [Ferroacidibacillus organovorans]